MKICLINNLYKPYIRGGAETVVELIKDGLEKDRHEVVVITTKPIFGDHAEATRELGVYYIGGVYFNLNKIPKVLRLIWHLIDMFDIGGYLRVKKILKKENPNVVMTHNLKGISYLIPRAVIGLNMKHIHTLHDIQLLHPSGLMFYGKEKIINTYFSKIYQSLCRGLFGSPNVVVSPSGWLLKEHADRGFFKNSKKVVIPNPVISEKAEVINRAHDNKKFNFLYVGLIEEHKGVSFMIKAFKKIPELELIIVGDGSQFKKAQELIGQNKNIKLLGRLSNDEVKKMMVESGALIMPSLCYENSPTVIYEAMNAELPVVASNIGGIPELIKDKNLLFESGNEKDLIDKIKWVDKHMNELRDNAVKNSKVKECIIERYVEKILNI